MDNINKAAAAGVIFFMVVLAGFIGIKVDQVTIALLGGAFIGIVIAIPTTAAIIIIRMRKPNDGQVQVPPQPVADEIPLLTTHNYYTQNNVTNVYVSRSDLSPFDRCTEVATALNVSRYTAERMIEAGAVRCLPAGR